MNRSHTNDSENCSNPSQIQVYDSHSFLNNSADFWCEYKNYKRVRLKKRSGGWGAAAPHLKQNVCDGLIKLSFS
jgi:hypothetical protein